jgi:hypothetical protein
MARLLFARHESWIGSFDALQSWNVLPVNEDADDDGKAALFFLLLNDKESNTCDDGRWVW